MGKRIEEEVEKTKGKNVKRKKLENVEEIYITKDTGKIERKNPNKKTKGKKKKPKKKMGKLLKILIVILLLLILSAGALAGFAWWYINDKLGKIQYEEIDRTQLGISDATKEELSGYRNIAILGIDSRAIDDYEKGNRSDCIIIVSINRKTNDVKMFSVYRDTYLSMDNGAGTDILDKITHAYAYGGAQNALRSLNINLDLNIEEVVTVNFDAVVSLVDAVGGIDMYIDSAEVKYINQYIDENNRVTKNHSSHITRAGDYHLDGVQALAYSRIRYTEGGDYKRTERMRNVIDITLKKTKTLSLTQLNNVADAVFPKIRTNIEKKDIIALLPKIATFSITESVGWPYEIQGATVSGVWYGAPVTLESNVIELHKKLFNQEDYEPSETVKEISEKISSKTGYRGN